jgi:hypothetical protein
MTAPTSARTRFLLPLGVAIVLLYYGSIFLQQSRSLFTGEPDFSAFYAAGRIVLSGNGHQIYNYNQQREAQQTFITRLSIRKGPLLFNHAPFELLLFVPLALFSYPRATTLWYGLNVAALLAVPFLLRRRLPFLKTSIFYALLAVAFFFPAGIALLQGQDSVLLLLLFTLGYLALADGHEVAAGCAFAMATFKPQLVLPILLIMGITRRWKLLLGFCGAGVALLAASVPLVGWRSVLEFPRFLLRFSHLPPGVAGAYPETMPNIRGLMISLFHASLSPIAIGVVVCAISALVLLLVGVACVRRQGSSLELSFSLIVVASLLIGYHVNGHDLTLLLLPIFLIADYVASHELTVVRALLGISAGLLWFLPSLELPPAITAVVALLLLAALLTESYMADGRAQQSPLRAARRNLPILADVPQDALP